MRLGDERSSNVEDRRGFGLPVIGGGIGAVVLALLALLFRGTPGQIDVPQNQSGPSASAPARPLDDPQVNFVSAVLADTETTWHDIFRTEAGRDYVEPKLVLFTDYVQSPCGIAQSATGPFYCPEDHKVYLDLGFFRELQDRFQRPEILRALT